MSIWWLIPLFALGCVSSALEPETPGKPSPADLVSHAVGRPLSVEQVEERLCTLPDGRSTVEVIKSLVYRDSAGRMRIEGSRGSPNQSYVFLVDPTSGARIVLSIGDKVAHRVTGPKAGESGFAYGAGGMGEALPSGDWRTSTEKLGRRAFEGIEAEGQRIMQTAADQPTWLAVHERWYSDELKLNLLAISSGPGWTHTARIHVLNRQEPDAALFSIPGDYTILEMKLPRGQEP